MPRCVANYLIISCLIAVPSKATTWLVDGSATGKPDGKSWTNAFTNLQDAIAVAEDGDDIWVASGTYHPDRRSCSNKDDCTPIADGTCVNYQCVWSSPRVASFDIKKNLRLYGGFPPGGCGSQGTPIDDLDLCRNSNPASNNTILSGDLGGNDVSSLPNPNVTLPNTFLDNSYNILTIDPGRGFGNPGHNVMVDGFVFSGGVANGSPSIGASVGAAVLSKGSTVTFRRCRFVDNYATGTGGAVQVHLVATGEHLFDQCDFVDNRASSGAAVANTDSVVPLARLRLSRSNFISNKVSGSGGAVINYTPLLEIIRCTFLKNEARDGGALYEYSTVANLTNNGVCTAINVPIACCTGNGTGTCGGNANGFIANTRFLGNLAQGGAAGAISVRDGNLLILNTLASGNISSASGGAIRLNTGVIDLRNSTISQNRCTNDDCVSGGIFREATNPFVSVRNSILWGNSDKSPSSNPTLTMDDQLNSSIFSYSCIQEGPIGTNGNTNLDPAFIDPDGEDDVIGTADDNYRLQVASPCADFGDNTALAITVSYTPSFTVNVDIGDKLRVWNDPKGGVTPSSMSVDMGAYESFAPSVPNGVIYVRESANGARTGGSWVDAYRYLQDALALSNGGPLALVEEIWVATGTYRPTEQSCVTVTDCGAGASSCTNGACLWTNPRSRSFRLLPNVGIYGGFAGSETKRTARKTGCAGGSNVGRPCGGNDDCPGSTCQNPTNLSGEITAPSPTDNIQHLIWAENTTSENCVLDGLTIRSAFCDIIDATGITGGGLYVTDGGVRVNRCRFKNNTARLNVGQGGGGAIGIGATGEAIVASSDFFGNYSENGGALYAGGGARGTFEDCKFEANTGNVLGGALFCGGGAYRFRSCTFFNNQSLDLGTDPDYKGGGAAFLVGNNIKFEGCRFCSNKSQAGSGGALTVYLGGDAWIINGIFTGNTAAVGGGAINLTQGAAQPSASVIASSFYGNDSLHANNIGTAIHVAGGVLNLENSVLWGNGDAPQNAIWISGGAPPTGANVYYSDVQGFAGSIAPNLLLGNFSTDPQFVNPSGGDGLLGTTDDDLAFGSNSPLRDRGYKSLLPYDDLDVDGDGNQIELYPFDFSLHPRVQGLALDIGALESPADCQSNGVPDYCELAGCETNLNGCPQSCSMVPDCNKNSIPDECDVGSVPLPLTENQEFLLINSNASSDGSQTDETVRIGKRGPGPWVATWIASRPGKDAVVTSSQDDGLTWSLPSEFGAGSGCPHLGGEEYWVRLASDTAGRWIAVFQSTSHIGGGVDPESDILYSFSQDGVTWSCPIEIAANSGSDAQPWVVSTGPGQWLVTWSTTQGYGGSGNDWDLVYSKSTCTAPPCSWTPPLPIHPSYATTDPSDSDDYHSRIACGPGKCVLVWVRGLGGLNGEYDIYWSETILPMAAGSWSAPLPIASYMSTTNGYDDMAEIATDGLDNWIVVWLSQANPFGTMGTDGEVFEAFRLAGSSTWGLTVVNQDAALDGNSPDVWPKLATDGQGNWLCTWNRQSGPGNNGILVAKSHNNGQTWSAPVVISGPSGFDNSTPDISQDGLGNWLIAWQSVNSLGGTLGTDLDILGIRWRATTDCNSNGILDECELRDGALDLNEDLRPDSCDCIGTMDTDGDGYDDECDNCPYVFNITQADVDGDTVGDACDRCDGYPDSADNDQDGVPDGCDNCPLTPNPANSDCNGDGDTVDNDLGEGVGRQCDRDGDGVGDICDTCPDDPNNPCGTPLGLGAMLMPPCGIASQLAIEKALVEVPVDRSQRDVESVTEWTTQHVAAFFHPQGIMPGKNWCLNGQNGGIPWNASGDGGAWFAVESSLIRIRWYSPNNALLAESFYNVPDSAATNDWTVGVRYFLDYNEDQFDRNADAVINTPYYSTIRYNSTILAGSKREIPGTGTTEQNPVQYYQFPDFRLEGGRVVAENYCPTGKVLIQYDDGPSGNLVGFEVVDISRRGTPTAQSVSVGRRLRLQVGADDCRAILVSNADQADVPAAWQRGVDSADIYPIRPETIPSNLVVAWYKSSNLESGISLGNCWPHEISRYASDWPSDPQAHIVAAGESAVPEGAKVDLGVGAGKRYCGAEIMYQAGFRVQDSDPQSEIVNGVFSASLPGFSVLRLDVDPPGLPACGSEVTFEVIASHDHRDVDQYACAAGRHDLTSCTTDAQCNTLGSPPKNDGVCAPNVFKGTFSWAIGQQITDIDHDLDARPYHYGFVKSGRPYAPNIYAATGQVIPVNTSAQIDPLEIWWYQEGRNCRCDSLSHVCKESGSSAGSTCSDDDSCGCIGNFAPGIFWPHKTAEYNAVWPPNSSCACSASACAGAGDKNGVSCVSARDCGCEELGDIFIASRLGGTFTQPSGAIVPTDFGSYAQIYSLGNFETRSTDALTLVGWNPNDEHAILLPVGSGLRVFAVRDDNPWGVTSGHPYTMVQYPSSGNPSSPDLYDIKVFKVQAEEIGISTCSAALCDGGLNDGLSCTVNPDCDFLLDYDFFVAQNDPTVRIPVVAGQPINPLFPVNFASPFCEDDGVPALPLTLVDGDALWQDRKGGIWAVEAEHDGKVFEYGICREGKCIGGYDHGQNCVTDAQCSRSMVPDGLSGISVSDIYLWENWAADYSCQPWRGFQDVCVNGICQAGPQEGHVCTANSFCVPDGVHATCNNAICEKSSSSCNSAGCQYPYPIRYRPDWPEVPPFCRYPDEPTCARPLNIGESVDEGGQCGQVQVLHDSVGLRVLDPTRWVSVPYVTFESSGANLDALPPHLIHGEIGGGGNYPDRVRYNVDGRRLLEFRGIMSDRDHQILAGLSTNSEYQNKISILRDLSRDQISHPVTDSAEKFVTVGDGDASPGWITVAFQNDTRCIDQGLPVSVEVWNVQCPPFQSAIRVIQPTCVFSEQQVLQFAGDLGGEPENLIFQWQYSVDYDPADPAAATWSNYNPPQGYKTGTGLREVLIEGASEFTLGDSWWRVRYRGYNGCPCPSACSQGCASNGLCNGGPRNGTTCTGDADCYACSGGASAGSVCRNDDDCPSGQCATLCCPTIGDGEEQWATNLNPSNTQVSPWTKPQLAEGWVKRVVRGLNPFDQRFEEFHNAPAATFVHMIEQAGKRFEQDVALNCAAENINNLGLIETYETVLKRAKLFSIDVGTSYRPATEAIMLAAGKVVDLYMLLGNEAYADAEDPTVGLFVGQGEEPQGYDPHAIFCFQDQVGSLLEEELGLLRGTDSVRDPDYDGDNHMIATVYNRLPWNFTSGSGQVAYANNYQLTDVEQAIKTYPQGHGDAWGHYLTATTKLYDLLHHEVFDWQVFTESVLVAGQPVEVGYKYERRFAEAAAAKARTGATITTQTFRALYDALPSSQEFGYRDTDPHRAWGVIDWGQRAGQAAYLDWVTVNSLLDENAIDAVCSNTNERCQNDASCQGTCVAGACSNQPLTSCTTDAQCGGLCKPPAGSQVCMNTGLECTTNTNCQGTCMSGQCSNDHGKVCTTDSQCTGVCQRLATDRVCANTGLACDNNCDCCCSLGCLPKVQSDSTIKYFCSGGKRHGLSCSVDADCGPACPLGGVCSCDECIPRNKEFVCAGNGKECSGDVDCLDRCIGGTCTQGGNTCTSDAQCTHDSRCQVDSGFVTSIRRIDRTTIPEIGEISASYNGIQMTLDQVDSGLNPLGLAKNVVPFGVSPRLLDEGQTHFDQVFKRAVAALTNAFTAFDYANESTRRLRRVQDEVDKFDDLIEERELDYTARLIEVFGRPYAEDIGPGLTYSPGYDGPDLYHFDYVDDNKLIPLTAGSNTVVLGGSFDEPLVDPITGEYSSQTHAVQFNISTDGLGLLRPDGWEDRPEPGEIQFARAELLQTMGRFQQALDRYEAHIQQVEHQTDLLLSLTQLNADVIRIQREGQAEQRSLNQEILISRSLITLFRTIAKFTESMANAGAECGPKIIGFIGGLANGVIFDPSFAVRCAATTGGAIGAKILDVTGDAQVLFELQRQHDKEFASAEQQIQITGVQGDYQVEQQVEALRQLVRQTPSLRLDLYLLEESVNQATGRYQAAVGKGLRLLEQRTAFRGRTADQITHHRYRDMAFRVFRNEALQKYQAQFDLAAQYAFLAAQAYDYESNLLRTDRLSGQRFLADLSAESSLGMLQGGSPIVGNGLAGMLAQMGLNFDMVVRPQLGLNSPVQFERSFSLRWELFRIPQSTSGDATWRNVLSSGTVPGTAAPGTIVERVDDINDVPEYRYYCKPLQSDSSGPSITTRALVIRFSTKVFSGLNFFGHPSVGDEVYPSTYDAIKVRGLGLRFTNYPTGVLNNQAEVYLVPVGSDVMRVPSDGSLRNFELLETTLPEPFPLATVDLERSDWKPFDELAGGSVAMLKRRLHPQVTALPTQGHADNEELAWDLSGRSVWNTQWVLIIPESELRGLGGAIGGLDYFTFGPTGITPGVGVRDIRLIFDSYGYIGGSKLQEESSRAGSE